MSLGVALSNAISGLRLNQQALSVLSNNMANVNTEGYSRKVLEQSAVYIEGTGAGVKIDDIVRKVDTYLQRSVISQTSVLSSSKTVSDYYDRVQNLLGAPGAENSLDEFMTTFFNTMQQMADQPDRTSYRSNMVNSANMLATQVSSLAQELESLRFQADGDIKGAVTDVNASLDKLYNLNAAIARTYGLGQSTAGLLDERDKALKSLADNMDITISYQQNGTVNVTAGNGVGLVDGVRHQLRYSPASSVDSMVDNQRLGALEVISIDGNGNVSGVASPLISGGKLGEITNGLNGGKIHALAELRDELIPDILDQLDMLASRLRDSMNGLHNNGSGWPPASSLTGTRQITGQEEFNWTGSVRIAVLNKDGSPVAAPYADEQYTGIRPLTIDLGALRSNGVNGTSTVQTLVDEINAHFGAPNTKAKLGNLNNIELVSNTRKLPAGTTFNFDLELDNISADDASVFVTNVTVKDSGGVTLAGALTQGAATLDLDPTNSYTTYNGESYVDIGLLSVEGLVPGDKIYLNAPGIASANNITAAELTGYFTIDEINGNSVRITTAGTANASSTVADGSGVKAMASYARVDAGEKTRTFENGEIAVDFSGNLASSYYDVTVDVGVVDADGNLSTSQITYRVSNNRDGITNTRYFANSATGNGTLEPPLSSQPSLRAILVDANGNELPKVNGKYADQEAYLKIVGGSDDYVVALDEMDSQQTGTPGGGSVGTNWGFSHFFGLNDFFVNNDLTASGDSIKNSAINLAVQQRILDNPNLVSAGRLELSAQSTDPAARPQYTYRRYAGDNSAAQAMAALANVPIGFDPAGGLPYTALSLQSYTSEMLGYLASLSSAASDASDNAQLLYDGFDSRNKAQSGVNLDEELANTIVFQNSYAASARIVTVVNEMFKSLVDAV